jgi:translation initiation factor IF-2
MATKTIQKKSSTTATAQQARPPVVVVMGHVDHGKTSLLDYIRKANVAAREAGGITQAVGAYEIEHTAAGAATRRITFIDTPGHEAFTAMRSRGATIADLAILVVAADDGVKPQTKEAIAILEETKTPFVVALNKIDKVSAGSHGSGMDKVIGELMTAGVMLEGYGGQVSYHGISAKTGEGVDELLDLVLLTADVEGLTYDPSAPASGFILEVLRDPRRGIEATAIIKNGTLRRGDTIRTATASGKVKILENFLGKVTDVLEPSAPALIIGLESLPQVGEAFTTGDEPFAPAARAAKHSINGGTGTGPSKNANPLNLILKASDAGSLEALAMVLQGIDNAAEKGLRIVEQGVGDISDGDVRHALATSATIIGFKNRVEKGALNLAEAQKVRIITSKIVYDLEKAVEEFLSGVDDMVAGDLEVLAVFNQEKLEKQLVGGRVINGAFRVKASCDIVRRDSSAPASQIKPLGSGRVLELRDKKAEITSAEKGKEIGVLVSSQVAIHVGDILIIRK